MDKQFPYDVTDELGEVQFCEEQCPGVYFISCIQKVNKGLCREFYIIEKGTCAIPGEAKRMGRQLAYTPDLLAYALEDVSGGQKIIEYEASKFRVMHGLALPEGVTLYDIALDGMETNPEYFGTYQVPSHTPLGYTLRHKAIDNGVYWIETDQCCRVFAVCSILCDELSDAACALAAQECSNKKGSLAHMMDYLFFTKQASCIPVYELMLARKHWWTSGVINRQALENAIWCSYPEYAANHNLQETAGQHDMLGLLLNDLNIPADLTHSDEHMIAISPNADTEFCTLME